MGGGVHEKHTEKHDVSSHAAGLSVVDLDGRLGPKLCFLNVEEVDVVSTDVDGGEEE